MPLPLPDLLSSLLGSSSRLLVASRLQRSDLPWLAGSADALCIAQLARHHAPQLLLVIASRPADALRLLEEVRWLDSGLRCHLLPDWETLPYDSFSPHQELISERLATLHAVSQGDCDVLITAASTAITRLPPPRFLAAHTFLLKKNERLSLDSLRQQLTVAGYQHVGQVVAPGEYSVRGGLIDLFPMGAVLPYRLDLFDEEIESIRTFDADTQRTLYPVPEIRLLPAHEFPLDDAPQGGRSRFRARFRETFEGDASRSPIYKDVSNGIAPGGIEYYLPLFFAAGELASLLDYLPAETLVFQHHDLPGALQDFWKDTRERHRLLSGDKSRPILPPEEIYLTDEKFFSRLGEMNRYVLPTVFGAELKTASAPPPPPLAVDRRATDPLAGLRSHLQNFQGRTLLLAESAGRRETIQEYLAEYGLKPSACADFAEFCRSEARFMLAVAPLSGGFMLPTAGLAIITENELYAATARPRTLGRRGGKRSNLEGWLRDLSELKINDPVVHEQHGIGRYLGLALLDMGTGQEKNEFLHLEYAGGDTLYVPVSQLHLISRYSGADPEAVQLHKLGSGQWEKAKKKAAMQVHDTAAELLNLYAQRAARKGHAFDFQNHDLDAFADGFGFEETPDQKAAIDAVINDMRAGKPMDRLVCGDVGFGKTEVALRATFIAVSGGKQVAVLCPTTLLAEQHYQNFADRFADWPVKVALLSRFRSEKEQTQAIKDLADGKIDILVGTHRLLSKDVQFSRLGLVVIDEEHRFGVRQKEALKALRAEVDVLTLTATPIPRTLGLSMEGLRDFSVIATAPQRRLAIKTFVSAWSNGLIREAVLREFQRGGQVYFLHNEVDTIANMQSRLEKLLPEARIVVGHGQLPERELERVMREFTQQKHNLLLCSTIIETGIDNPHANTIIINRADKFGLAQLHQLRGRVGRSHHQAYAYLLTHEDAKPSKQATRRLEAIQMMEELGSGFFLAMHDLEIRGAGEVLGENQSGEIHEIGFALYTRMLNSAVKALKEGKEPDLGHALDIKSTIDLSTPALLPEAYAPDVHERLTLYKRLANTENLDELQELQEELIDRFGELPPQAQALMETHRLRILADPLGILKIEASAHAIQLHFSANAPIDPLHLMALIQQDRHLKFAGPEKLNWKRASSSLRERVQLIRELLKKLQGPT